MLFKSLLLMSIGFQTPATTVMEAIVDMHHYVFFYLILVFVFVIYMYLHILWMYYFIPTYFYDISFKFNDNSIIYLKLIRVFIQLFLNFEFFSSYIIYFSQRQAIRFALNSELQYKTQAHYYPVTFPYRQYPFISDIIDMSEIIFTSQGEAPNEYNNISLELSNFQRVEHYEKEENYNLVFQAYQNLPTIFQILASRQHEKILKTRLINHNSNLEIIWTLIPSFFLFLIALPSFALLYEFDEILSAAMNFKVIGYQQFQTYEILDLYVNDSKVNNLYEIMKFLEFQDLNLLKSVKIENKFKLYFDAYDFFFTDKDITLEQELKFIEVLKSHNKIELYNLLFDFFFEDFKENFKKGDLNSMDLSEIVDIVLDLDMMDELNMMNINFVKNEIEYDYALIEALQLENKVELYYKLQELYFEYMEFQQNQDLELIEFIDSGNKIELYNMLFDLCSKNNELSWEQDLKLIEVIDSVDNNIELYYKIQEVYFENNELSQEQDLELIQLIDSGNKIELYNMLFDLCSKNNELSWEQDLELIEFVNSGNKVELYNMLFESQLAKNEIEYDHALIEALQLENKVELYYKLWELYFKYGKKKLDLTHKFFKENDLLIELLFIKSLKLEEFSFEKFEDKVKQVVNTFDSVLIAEENLKKGQKRLLEVDNPLILPFQYILQAIITAGDVLHSQAIPSFGIKVDAVPGRLNQVQFLITRPGTFYGQCSELCGLNHGFMPIVIKVPFLKDIN